jgi:hypothetical protein
MADVEHLLYEFIAEDRSGGDADPLAYLRRARGTDRAELEALIDAYLARAPRRRVDQAADEPATARRTADELTRALFGCNGWWPALLPRLRAAARLRRSEVVDRLARDLGATEREAKVGAYYHAMEQGTLPAAGVSDRVLDALAAIVGTTAAQLRDAGRAIGGPPPGPHRGAAFARIGTPDPELLEEPPAAPAPAPAAGQRDEIDELFTGAQPQEPR